MKYKYLYIEEERAERLLKQTTIMSSVLSLFIHTYIQTLMEIIDFQKRMER